MLTSNVVTRCAACDFAKDKGFLDYFDYRDAQLNELLGIKPTKS